ncbi:hypothetical protein [Streptomyces sp. NPDC004134]|uniref:hypothetical protein n=1 Tax=Streptomyces sp. NPDC004134 TaxID=3364691 RepID=UPI0036C29C1A
MSEPTPMPAAEPETATAPPHVRQPAPRWPEPGGGDVAEAAESAAAPVQAEAEPVRDGRPEAEAEPEAESASVGAGPVAPEPVEAAPVPLGVGRTPTGNADVDAALDRLADADELPTGSHLEVYEDAHGRMREALEELDRTEGPPPAQPPRGPAPYAQGQSRPGPHPPAGPAPYGQGHARPGPPVPPPRPGVHPAPYRRGNP